MKDSDAESSKSDSEDAKPKKLMPSIESTYHKDLAEKLCSKITKEQCGVDFEVIEDELLKGIILHRLYFKNNEKIKKNHGRILYLLD